MTSLKRLWAGASSSTLYTAPRPSVWVCSRCAPVNYTVDDLTHWKLSLNMVIILLTFSLFNHIFWQSKVWQRSVVVIFLSAKHQDRLPTCMKIENSEKQQVAGGWQMFVNMWLFLKTIWKCKHSSKSYFTSLQEFWIVSKGLKCQYKLSWLCDKCFLPKSYIHIIDCLWIGPPSIYHITTLSSI